MCWTEKMLHKTGLILANSAANDQFDIDFLTEKFTYDIRNGSKTKYIYYEVSKKVFGFH